MSNVDLKNEKKESETSGEAIDGISNEDLVDPRVQIELERLNTATDLINKLEIELDEARSNFRLLLSESSIRVNQLAKKLGGCVEKARPYYEARMRAKQLQSHTQKAALRYERASSAHCAAKEMVFLAEEGLKKEGRCFDPAWQEMLNHATLRVNEAESERVLSQQEHQKTSLAYNEAEKIVQQLHQELKKSIVKSSLSTRRSLLQLNNLVNQHQLQLLPYFEMKAQFNQLLEEQRRKVHHLEENVLKMKMSYADALHNLEEISDEIHQKRKSQENQMLSEKREIVGAESPNFSCDGTNLLYHMKVDSSIEKNDGHFSTEDMYRSLPSNLKLKPGMIPSDCSANSAENIHLGKINSEDEFLNLPSNLKLSTNVMPESPISNVSLKTMCLPRSEKGSVSEESIDKMHRRNDLSKCAASDCILLGNSDEKNINLVSNNRPYLVPHNAEQSHLCENNHENEENESNNTHNKSLDGDELPGCKFLVPDFNILRVQREEISDSESLASNDTVDTLDDNQIECLLLEKMLPLGLQDSDTENTFTSLKQKDDLNL